MSILQYNIYEKKIRQIPLDFSISMPPSHPPIPLPPLPLLHPPPHTFHIFLGGEGLRGK